MNIIENENRTKVSDPKNDYNYNVYNDISHEIRTPLNAIVGFSQLLRNNDLCIEQIKLFSEIIEDNSKGLLLVLDDLLLLNINERSELTCKSFSVNLLLSELQKEFSFQIKESGKNITLLKKLGNNDMIINSNENHIKEVFVRLFNNALKFTINGEIEFGYIENVRGIVFFIRDTGIGIDKINFKNIFAPFFKAGHNNSGIYNGIGLGLTFCERLIIQLGGNIWLESEPNKGSTFYFNILTKSKN